MATETVKGRRAATPEEAAVERKCWAMVRNELMGGRIGAAQGWLDRFTNENAARGLCPRTLRHNIEVRVSELCRRGRLVQAGNTEVVDDGR